MGTNTGIEYVSATWNPWTGCTKVSAGCDNCYMYRGQRRWGRDPSKIVRSSAKTFNLPLAKKRDGSWAIPPGSFVFVCSWSDFFHEEVPDQWRDEALNIIWERPDLTFLILTKRTGKMRSYLYNSASRRSFGWTHYSRTPMHKGYVDHIDTWQYRNQCGYVGCVGDGSTYPGCDHPENIERGQCGATAEDREANDCDTDCAGLTGRCSERQCPIAIRVDEKPRLLALGMSEDDFDWTIDNDGGAYAEDSEWMELVGRPYHAFPHNVIFGATVEKQEHCEERLGDLWRLKTGICYHARTFVSAEPLLGPLDLSAFIGAQPEYTVESGDGSEAGRAAKVSVIDWVVCGGESGPNARPMHPDWARSVRDQCKEAGVPFFFKQWGEYMPAAPDLDPGECGYKCATTFIDDDGRDVTAFDDWHDRETAAMWRVGKKQAGKLLDGVEHLERPDSERRDDGNGASD